MGYYMECLTKKYGIEREFSLNLICDDIDEMKARQSFSLVTQFAFTGRCQIFILDEF